MLKKIMKYVIFIMVLLCLLSSSALISPVMANAAWGKSMQICSTSTNQRQQSIFNIFFEVAKVLGVNEQTIIDKVKSGMTLGEIAESYGVSQSVLIDQLEDKVDEIINEAMKYGAISQTQANNMKIYLKSMLKVLVENQFTSSGNMLSAPESISATSVNKSSISLSWSTVKNATSYYIYRATSSSGSYKKVGTVRATRFTDKKLRKGVTYYYKVRAVSQYDVSPYSYVVKAKVGTRYSSLKHPNGVAAKTVNESRISLQWNSADKATNYYIYRATSYYGNFSKMASVNGTNYTDDNLSQNTTYYYCIQAVNSSSISWYSSVVSATTTKNTLGVPSNLTIKPEGDDEIFLKWNSVTHATYYYIYRASSSTGTFSKIATVDDTDYTDDDLNEDTTYYYKVQAYDGKDTSDYSSIVRAKTGDSNSDLDEPDDLNITNVKENEITLEWDEVDDADYYYVYRSKSKSGTYSKIGKVYDNEYIDNDLNSDTTYYYKVKACDGDETSDYSSIVSVTTHDESDLDEPDDLRITDVSEDEISLKWDEVDDADYYLVYRSKSKNGSYSMVAKVNDNDYTDEDLNDDTTYYYKIRAYKDGKASDFSSIVKATTDED